MGLLEGKVVVVCGAGPSLGQQMVSTALREGAKVVYGDCDPDQIDSVRKALDPTSDCSLGREMDMSNPGDPEKLVDETVERFGRCDAVVQTAAAFGGGRLLSGEFDDFRRILEVNFLGTLRMVRAAVPAMRAVGGGAVVIIGSVVAIRPATEYPDTMPYAASKGALASAARYIAHEVGAAGIRINTVIPGFKWGASLEQHLPQMAASMGLEPAELLARFRAPLALKRFGDDESVADAAAFFCSDYAKNITGQQLVVDGGGLLL